MVNKKKIYLFVFIFLIILVTIWRIILAKFLSTKYELISLAISALIAIIILFGTILFFTRLEKNKKS